MAMAVYNNDYDSTFRCVELDDAKSIVKYSSIIHKSITYLDLNIGEYNNFKSEVATLNTDSSRAPNASFMPKEIFKSLSRTLPLKYDNEFYTPKIYVSNLWYRRKLQDFAILFIKRAEHKLFSLEKLRFYGKFKYTLNKSFVIFDYESLNILCIESYDSDRVKGVLIALDISDPDAENAGAEVREYFLYHNSVPSGISLSETTYFDKDIIRLLMHNGFYRFVPHLLKRGFYLKFPLSEDYFRYWYVDMRFRIERGISRRRRDLAYYVYSIYEIHLRRLKYSKNFVRSASEALTMIWRSIPDALLSQEEIAYINKEPISAHSAEEIQNFYQKIAGDCPLRPTPRFLTHYCRFVVRKALAFNRELPHGISKLGLPPLLQSFLMMEY